MTELDRIKEMIEPSESKIELNYTQALIIGKLYDAFEVLGADSHLLSIVGSLGDTLSDQEVLSELNGWLSGDRGLKEIHKEV